MDERAGHVIGLPPIVAVMRAVDTLQGVNRWAVGAQAMAANMDASLAPVKIASEALGRQAAIARALAPPLVPLALRPKSISPIMIPPPADGRVVALLREHLRQSEANGRRSDQRFRTATVIAVIATAVSIMSLLTALHVFQ